MTLRNTAFERVADVVIYPQSTEVCEKIVTLANKYDVVIVPYGGGTNVT
jgi:alkyldihydroxyacetonephosphate synthase